MRLCLFEDDQVARLEPLTLTRPAYQLRCGAQTVLERQQRLLGATEVGGWVRPELAAPGLAFQPSLPMNDAAWLAGVAVYANARWLPEDAVDLDLRTPQVGICGGQVAYVVLPRGETPPPAGLAPWLADWRSRLDARPAGGIMANYLWDLVDSNGEMLARDAAWFAQRHPQGPASANVAVAGPAERWRVAKSATIEPFVFVDTRQGPVLVDEGAIVHSFSRLEGPCYVGKETLILGAKLRGGTIGPRCRIGGEFEASIVQGHSNKYHDGFLGHSYVGEWVNLAAGTQTSDLRNDYGEVRVTVAGHRVATGKTKIGSYVGDHTKTGLGACFNTGSSVGAFCNVLPTGALLPRVIPSFCLVSAGQIQAQEDLKKLLHTASVAMSRRGLELTEALRAFYLRLYDRTAAERARARAGERGPPAP